MHELVTLAEAETERALGGLPGALKQAAESVPVCFEAKPNHALVEDGLDDDLLGLFVGEAFPDIGNSLMPMPAQIFLFLENIWDFSEGEKRVYCREVRKTYLHELGHYLGLDEDALWERGMD